MATDHGVISQECTNKGRTLLFDLDMDTNGHTPLCEDYVSFEIAKLLKKKGFGFNSCSTYYTLYGEVCEIGKSQEIGIAPRPTLQMAMKWLREVHNLVIEPYRTACGYLYTISSIPYGSTKYDNSEAYNGDDDASGQWTTWENACEDGIRYCLENLI